MKYIMEFISMRKCFVAPLCCLSQFLETGADSHLLWNKCTLVPQYVFPCNLFPFIFLKQSLRNFSYSLLKTELNEKTLKKIF